MPFRAFCRASRAASAVEFALIAPVLLLFLFGLIGFGVVLSTANGLQQLAAEAARASISGLSDTERTQLAQAFVNGHIAAYPFLDTRQLTVATAAITVPSPSFQVSLNYDLSKGVAAPLANLLPMLPMRLQRSAVVLTSSSL